MVNYQDKVLVEKRETGQDETLDMLTDRNHRMDEAVMTGYKV